MSRTQGLGARLGKRRKGAGGRGGGGRGGGTSDLRVCRCHCPLTSNLSRAGTERCAGCTPARLRFARNIYHSTSCHCCKSNSHHPRLLMPRETGLTRVRWTSPGSPIRMLRIQLIVTNVCTAQAPRGTSISSRTHHQRLHRRTHTQRYTCSMICV